MATKIRPELSKKNELWISKHRYYELKHFCMQYPEWKKELSNIDGMSKSGSGVCSKNSNKSDPTMTAAILRTNLNDKIQQIEKIARDTDKILWDYLVKGVTEERSYTYLKNYLNIPCSRDVYYQLYRKFFSLLDKYKK